MSYTKNISTQLLTLPLKANWVKLKRKSPTHTERESSRTEDTLFDRQYLDWLAERDYYHCSYSDLDLHS